MSAVALSGFAVLGITGDRDYRDLEQGCGRSGSCSDGDVSAVRTKLFVADVALGVSVLALGVSVLALGGAILAYVLQPRVVTTTTTAASP